MGIDAQNGSAGLFWRAEQPHNGRMKLYIGNKNYSSWSMRPWLMLRQFGIPFEEHMLWFTGGFEPGSAFKNAAAAASPTAKVPVLHDGDLVIHDTLAIAEYVAENHPNLPLWPRDKAARARARSICAEMHSGFGNLRSHCPVNIEAQLQHLAPELIAKHPGIGTDVARIDAIWQAALDSSGGPMLFGEFSIADAYFAPVCTRIRTYGLPVSTTAQAYIDRVLALNAMQQWVKEALAEAQFVPEDEPYRQSR